MSLPGQRRTTVIAVLGMLACACGGSRLQSICASDSNCGDGLSCIEGVCQRPPSDSLPDAGDGRLDGGDPDPTCTPGLCTLPLPPPRQISCMPGLEWDDALEACAAPVEIVDCFRPETGFFTPEVMWEFAPKDWNEVITTPVVIDVDGDGASDVIAPFFQGSSTPASPAILRALSGVDGHVLWEVPASEDGLSGQSTLATAVLNSGEPPTIVGEDRNGLLSAYDGATGALLWRSHDSFGSPAQCEAAATIPAIADLDADGHPEIVCGFTVFDRSGELRWSQSDSLGPFGTVVAIGDLNGDGKLDLTDGTRAFQYDGQLLWDVGTPIGGLAAVADIMKPDGTWGLDGQAEVVITRAGMLEVRDGESGQLDLPPMKLPTWDGVTCTPNAPSTGIGGAPAIGDVDGYGTPEIAVTSGECLTMVMLLSSRPAELVTMWAEHAVDASSEATGAALFDFDDRGQYDVVYADETELHINDGWFGSSWYKAPHCSATIYEEPVVADVDGDGSANIVLVRNDVGGGSVACDRYITPGVLVLREMKSRWANARAIWNQHAYVATRICDGRDWVCDALGPTKGAYGMVPAESLPPWKAGEPSAPIPYNAVRANTGGPWAKVWGADAEISHVIINKHDCPLVTARVRVVNHGQVPLRPRTQVVVRSQDGSQSASGSTSRPIPPGGAEIVDVPLPWAARQSVTAQVDGEDRTEECREDNNAFGPVTLQCPE